jgi:hypothetical protein
MIRFVCHHCDKTLEAPERIAGRKIRCPNCGEVRQVPAPEGPEDTDVRPAAGGHGTKLLGAVAVLSCLCVILLGLSGLALLNGGSLRPPDHRRHAAAPTPLAAPEAPQQAGQGAEANKVEKDQLRPGQLVPPRRDNVEWPEFVPTESGAKPKERAEEEEDPVIRKLPKPKATDPDPANQPPTPKQQPAPTNPPPTGDAPTPAFDPNDLGRTVLWAEELTRQLRADAGNALRQNETATAIRKTFRPLYASKLRWAMKVKEIKADGTVRLDGGRKPLVLGMTGGGREEFLVLQAGATIDRRRATALNPGDEVVVDGLVDAVVLKPDYVLLVIGQMREHAERPGRKGKGP